MERISLDDQYAQIAHIISKRGTCNKLRVGCVITQNGRIVATGYNGGLKGEKECDWGVKDFHCIEASCIHAVHAEANAIYFAAKQGISLKGATMYCTHSPCTDCAEAIVQAGIIKVCYSELFRDPKPLERLNLNGVLTEYWPI